jgi:hypothetical protein
MDDYLQNIQSKRQQSTDDQRDTQEKYQHLLELEDLKSSIKNASDVVSQAIDRKSNKVLVGNFPKAFSIDNIDKLVADISLIKDELTKETPEIEPDVKLLQELLDAVKQLPTEKVEIPEGVEEVTVKNLKDYTDKIDEVVRAVKAIKLSCEPKIDVKASDVIVQSDFTAIEKKLDIVTKAVQAISIVIPEKDDSDILKSLKKVSDSINSLSFPVPNYVLPYKNIDGAATQAQVTDNSEVLVASINSSTALSYDGNGDLQYIDETINGVTYRTTLTYTARVLVGISEAVEL